MLLHFLSPVPRAIGACFHYTITLYISKHCFCPSLSRILGKLPLISVPGHSWVSPRLRARCSTYRCNTSREQIPDKSSGQAKRTFIRGGISDLTWCSGWIDRMAWIPAAARDHPHCFAHVFSCIYGWRALSRRRVAEGFKRLHITMVSCRRGTAMVSLVASTLHPLVLAIVPQLW